MRCESQRFFLSHCQTIFFFGHDSYTSDVVVVVLFFPSPSCVPQRNSSVRSHEVAFDRKRKSSSCTSGNMIGTNLRERGCSVDFLKPKMRSWEDEDEDEEEERKAKVIRIRWRIRVHVNMTPRIQTIWTSDI